MAREGQHALSERHARDERGDHSHDDEIGTHKGPCDDERGARVGEYVVVRPGERKPEEAGRKRAELCQTIFENAAYAACSETLGHGRSFRDTCCELGGLQRGYKVTT